MTITSWFFFYLLLGALGVLLGFVASYRIGYRRGWWDREDQAILFMIGDDDEDKA